MKHLILILLLMFTVQCNAQTQIVSLTDCDSYFNKFSGDYYQKDIATVQYGFVFQKYMICSRKIKEAAI